MLMKSPDGLNLNEPIFVKSIERDLNLGTKSKK